MKLTAALNGLNLPKVEAHNLILNNFYVCNWTTIDDETGAKKNHSDIVWFYMGQYLGEGATKKESKLFKMGRTQKVAKFSQLPGGEFFGPFYIEVEDGDDKPLVNRKDEGFEALLGSI